MPENSNHFEENRINNNHQQQLSTNLSPTNNSSLVNNEYDINESKQNPIKVEDIENKEILGINGPKSNNSFAFSEFDETEHQPPQHTC